MRKMDKNDPLLLEMKKKTNPEVKNFLNKIFNEIEKSKDLEG